ncbi:hypothetical protein [Microvirga roseola]|nr:hypothetical protein [Microvirga roseola]
MNAGPSHTPEKRSKRLLWFVFIYVASLAVFAALVYGLRGLIPR